LRKSLPGHEILTAYELGWSNLKNGELIRLAETQGLDILVATDSHLKYQQNLTGRRIAIIVLLSTSWLRIRLKTQEIEGYIAGLSAGGFIEVAIQF
jgi:hypothetical protein